MTLLVIFWLIVFIKQLLFWLWFWQLKEYHLGRFLAHFEAQSFKKIISSFWRLKHPRFTKKITLIFFACLAVEFLLLWRFSFVQAVILTIFLVPLFVLSFQIPTVFLRNIIINKAKKKRARFKNLLVVGITGSYGKTSTKEFLYAILSEKFKVLKTKEHQNSEMGISLCILNDLKKEQEIFICEMGAYNRGGIKLLCDIAEPKIGVLAGINEQHMATQGSQENIIKTKYELIESLPEDGAAFFNGKNKYCRELFEKTKIRKHLYGENAGLGMENFEGARAVAKALGMIDEEIDAASQRIENKFPGIKIIDGANNLKVIDATYSANPESVIVHLEYLKTFSGKRIIVMPCLIELGSASKEVHRRIGRKISEVCDLAVITTNDRFKELRETAGDKAVFIENPQEIFERIKRFVQAGDVVLLESRVPGRLIDFLLK